MNNIITLDCTLRDGGYCNKWNFGEDNIKNILSGVSAANVEIIECGFLTNTVVYNPNVTKYTELNQLDKVIPIHGDESKYVVMMNFGEYDVDRLPKCEDTCIDGIRIAFHKKNVLEALEVAKRIKEKGYLLFIQPMVSMLYSDQEFDELIVMANKLNPYAFYIVDSFGMMSKNSLEHYFVMAENALDTSIFIGFHSHNNLQSAFSNALSLVERDAMHNIIIDCSIYGMGRGAGNLNLELFLNEISNNRQKEYQIKPILQLMDDVLNQFYEENPWGYSLPNYLSAVHMIHPNYAGFLSEKKTLTIEDIDEIFSMMDSEKGCEYDEEYIESVYIKYMSAGITRNEHLDEIRKKTNGKEILLIAPGKSAISEEKTIIKYIEDNSPVVISINHEYPRYPSDFIFISNIRRFRKLDKKLYGKTIATSNIKTTETYVGIDYYKLINNVDTVRDNAGLMAIKFAMLELKARKILIAGLDGYSHDLYANFETKDMSYIASSELLDRMNFGMQRVIDEYKQHVDISFITSSMLNGTNYNSAC